MRLIVDTNRIIAALIKNSMSRRIITHLKAELITLNFSEKEIDKHKDEIIKKAGITEFEFYTILNKLKEHLIFLSDEAISTKIKEAKNIMDKIDFSDTPFIAAALLTGADIWSDDKHFEKQKKIKIWKTEDLAKFL